MSELTLRQISPVAGPSIEPADAERLAAVIKVLANPGRLRLVSLLQSAGGEIRAGDLIAPLGLTQPTVSHHLHALMWAGLIEREKRGKGAYYRLAPNAIENVVSLLTSLCGSTT